MIIVALMCLGVFGDREGVARPLAEGAGDFSGRCRTWHWTSLQCWKLMRQGNTFDWTIQRSGAASAIGTVNMQLRVDTQCINPEIKVVVVSKDRASHNIWHRMTSIFTTWLSVEAVKHLKYVPPDAKAFVEPFESDVWVDIFKKANVSKCYKYIINAPRDGFLWDLAWDNKARLLKSDVWNDFIATMYNVLHIRTPPSSTKPIMCLMVRYKMRAYRIFTQEQRQQIKEESVANKFIFVELDATSKSFTSYVQVARTCDVLFGMHGAGMINSMFMPPASAVIEVLPPQSHFAYYRNIAKLSGHIYMHTYQNQLSRIRIRHLLYVAKQIVSHKLKRHDAFG